MAKELTKSQMDELTAAINIVKSIHQKMVFDIMEAGKALKTIKSLTDHGQWLGYLESDIQMHPDTAQKYMALYDDYKDNPKLIDGMSIRLLMSMSAEDRDHHKKEHAAGRTPTATDIKAHQKERKVTKELNKALAEVQDQPQESDEPEEILDQEGQAKPMDTGGPDEKSDSSSINISSDKELDKESILDTDKLDDVIIEITQNILDLEINIDALIQLLGDDYNISPDYKKELYEQWKKGLLTINKMRSYTGIAEKKN